MNRIHLYSQKQPYTIWKTPKILTLNPARLPLPKFKIPRWELKEGKKHDGGKAVEPAKKHDFTCDLQAELHSSADMVHLLSKVA